MKKGAWPIGPRQKTPKTEPFWKVFQKYGGPTQPFENGRCSKTGGVPKQAETENSNGTEVGRNEKGFRQEGQYYPSNLGPMVPFYTHAVFLCP